jgi:hypothetical protein
LLFTARTDRWSMRATVRRRRRFDERSRGRRRLREATARRKKLPIDPDGGTRA